MHGWVKVRQEVRAKRACGGKWLKVEVMVDEVWIFLVWYLSTLQTLKHALLSLTLRVKIRGVILRLSLNYIVVLVAAFEEYAMCKIRVELGDGKLCEFMISRVGYLNSIHQLRETVVDF